MAGDWIKMREGLHEDPAVVEMAARLNTRPEHVVGYCHRFWSWASRNSHDGSVTGVTLEALGGVLSLPNFPGMLCEVGWLEYDDSSGKPRITIPKFDRHLSQGAKARALAAERVRNARVTSSSRSQRNEIVTREEKRREEYKPPTPFSLPAEIDNKKFRDALAHWLDYKKQRGESYKPAGLTSMVALAASRAAEHGVEAVVEAMGRAMANGWKGWDHKSTFESKNGMTPKRSDYREVPPEIFKAHIDNKDFKTRPLADEPDADGRRRWFGELRNGRKIECHK